jgi:hypothetical protein
MKPGRSTACAEVLAAVPVSLAIFDLQGRRMAILLNRQPQTAGNHAVPLQPHGWRAGCYFCQIGAGGRSLTRKMVVVR